MTAFENGGRRDLDIGAHAGISAPAYERLEPFQWPKPAGAHPISPRFFANGGFFTPDGKARFVALDVADAPLACHDYPLTLNTGRVRDHWHTMTRTGKSQRLSAHIAEPFAEFHPDDASELAIDDAAIAEIESRHGKVLVRARITDRQQRGAVFAPMHWNDQFAANARIDALVAAVTDPHSGQPALKNVTVRVRRVDMAVYGFAVSRSRPEPGSCDYWAIGGIDGGWRLELARALPVPDIEEFAANLFLGDSRDGVDIVAFADRDMGEQRLAAFAGPRLVAALFLARTPVAVSRSWAVAQLTADHADLRMRSRLVAGRPGADMPDKGAIVCSCFSIGARQIAAAVRGGAMSVEAIGRLTNAGTNCGSCKSEIRQVLEARRVVAAE